MSSETDYTALLADLEVERAELDAAIALIRRRMAGRGIEAPKHIPDASRTAGTSAPAPGVVTSPADIAPGTFHGLSVSEAARKFLEMTKQKQKTTVICDALRAGGIESSAQNFYSNVYNTLMRASGFIRIGSSWALADWHPGRPATTAPRKPKKKKAKTKAGKLDRAVKKAFDAAVKKEGSATAERITAFGKSGPKAAAAVE